MKTIGCVGCSWTYGYSLEKDDTYPSILSNYLNDVRVINAGHCGADIDYAIYSSTKLIEEYNLDTILFQLTTLDRLTIGTDGFDNFTNNRFVDDRKEDVYSIDDRLLGIGDNVKTKIALGSYINADGSKEYRESKIKNSESDYKIFLKVLYENVIYSNYSFYRIKNTLKIFDHFAKSKNCKVYYFRWLNSTPRELISEDLDCVDQSVEDIIDKSLYIDHGYHLGKEGNTQLVEKLILPMLRES